MKNSPITEIWRRAASIIAKIIRAIIPLDLSFNKTVIFFQGNCFSLDKTLFNYEVTSPQMKTESYVLYSYLYKIIIQCWHLHFPPCYDPISASWNDLLILEFVYAAQSFFFFYDTIIIVNVFDKLRVWNHNIIFLSMENITHELKSQSITKRPSDPIPAPLYF